MEHLEARHLCAAVTDAVRLACDGDVAGGFELLSSALRRARELANTGEPWARELVAHYGSALGQFAMLHCEKPPRPVKRVPTLAQVVWHRRHAN